MEGVAVEGLADCAVGGEEFADVVFDLCAESCLIEVNAEDVLAGIELAEAAVVLVRSAYLKRCDDCLEFVEHRIRRRCEWFTVILDALEVTSVAGKDKRDEFEVGHVETSLDVFLDRLSETDR